MNYNILYMSSRILSTDEILAVGSILKDKESINLLKEIRDNVITEEDTKGKRKNNDVFNFVGFSSSEDILGEDSESDNYKSKKAKIDKLVKSSLVLEGFHIPLERKNEKKFGDVKVAATDEKIYKYQITDEGYAILNIVENSEPKPQTTKQAQTSSNSNKDKEIAEFRAQQKKELGLEDKK